MQRRGCPRHGAARMWRHETAADESAAHCIKTRWDLKKTRSHLNFPRSHLVFSRWHLIFTAPQATLRRAATAPEHPLPETPDWGIRALRMKARAKRRRAVSLRHTGSGPWLPHQAGRRHFRVITTAPSHMQAAPFFHAALSDGNPKSPATVPAARRKAERMERWRDHVCGRLLHFRKKLSCRTEG